MPLRQAGPSLVWPILCHREDHRKHFPLDFPRQLKCHCPVFDIMASLVLFWQCHTLVFHFSSIVAAFILTPDWWWRPPRQGQDSSLPGANSRILLWNLGSLSSRYWMISMFNVPQEKFNLVSLFLSLSLSLSLSAKYCGVRLKNYTRKGWMRWRYQVLSTKVQDTLPGNARTRPGPLVWMPHQKGLAFSALHIGHSQRLAAPPGQF